MRKAHVGILTAVAMVFTAGVAFAAAEYDVTATKGEITIATKGEWHVNKEYPWKATQGDKKFDKSKFSLDEKSAKVTGLPSGTVHIKGAVCSGPQCLPFEKDVTVP